MARKRPARFISVTIDFLRQIPYLDVTKEEDLRKALALVGFQMYNKQGELVDPEILVDVNIRCKDKPYLFRKTIVFTGRMRSSFSYASIYDNIDILDVETYGDSVSELVNSLPDFVPVIDKPNARKYTKKQDSARNLNNFTDFISSKENLDC